MGGASSSLPLASALHQWPVSEAVMHPRWPDAMAYKLYFGYLVWIGVLFHLVPGKHVQGQEVPSGGRLVYKINAMPCLLITHVALYLSCFQFKLFSATVFYDNLGDMFLVGTLFTVFFQLYLMLKKRIEGSGGRMREEPKGFLAEFWFGSELNPRVLGMDVKMHIFYRYGMSLWSVFCVSALAKQYQEYGMLSTPLLMYTGMALWYCVDYALVEENALALFDIIEEGAGWMLNFGCLSFIPFVFHPQLYFLLDPASVQLGSTFIALNIALFFVGFAVFRTANNQKHYFKVDPSAPLWGTSTRPIRLRGKLLVSGLWGVVRKPNYLGDLMICWSMAIMCGTASIVPYVYPLYLTLLLSHRQYRDHVRCASKYGDLWTEYCRRVPYIVIPYVL